MSANVDKIKFWCYKVLPLVYDDSLSYYELLCKLTAKINELVEIVNTSPDNVYNIVKEILDGWLADGTMERLVGEAYKHFHADNHYDIYVAGTTGSDDNDGSKENPIQTLDHAFDMMAMNGAGLYIHILESGSYDLTYKTIHAASVHITTDASNVIVNWGGDLGSHKFYASYLHISGQEDNNITFNNDTDGECGFEPGKLFANHVTFTANEGAYFAIYGGSGQIRNSTLKCPFRFGGSNVIIDNCTFNPDVSKIASPYTRIIQAYNGSVLTFVGNITFTAKANYGAMTSWIAVNRSTVFFGDDASFIVNNADSDIPLFGGECDSFISTWAKINDIINGNNTSLDNCIFNGTMSRGSDVKAMPRIISDSFAVTVAAGSTEDTAVTFPYEFAGSTPPFVFTQISGTAQSADIGNVGVQIVTNSTTQSGCTIRVSNASENSVTVRVRYLCLHE